MSFGQTHDELVGRSLGEFVLRERIGEGGFGAVYRASQPALDREAVIKVLHQRLHASSAATQRFLREAKLASKLDHPYAAHIYAFGAESDGELWIAMELVRGTPLDQLLRDKGTISLEQLVPLLDRVCEVVHTAHEQGIVHRDLKPANVMVLSRAGRLLPKLLDFGIAKGLTDSPEEATEDGRARGAPVVQDVLATGETVGETEGANGLTRRGAIMGSPLYMAPEQWIDAGDVDARTDLYALAILAYECLVGQPPFRGTTVSEIARAHAKRQPPPLGPRFPAALDKVFAKALAKKASERYRDALELARAFRQASGIEPEKVSLPALDARLREAIVDGAPQPIAEAIAGYEAARNAHQARAALVAVARTLARYLGLLAISARSRVGGGEAGVELLRALARHSLADREWLALASQLVRPWLARRDAYPIPEMITALHDASVIDDLEALVAMRDAEAANDDTLVASLEIALVRLTRVLEAMSFVRDYPLVVTAGGGYAERWMGVRRTQRSTLLVRGTQLAVGVPAVLDGHGTPVLALAPLIQLAAPSPGAPLELFLFDGRDRRGAKLVALPTGFEHHDDAVWDWFRAQLGTLEEGDAAVSDEKPPYRGLQAFSADDGASFFGREKQVDAFVNRLKVQPLLAVVGRSGAGKSSFVHAGVVPAFDWRAIAMRPGALPLGALVARLEHAGIAGATKAELARDRDALGALLRADAAARGPLVLVVDQLEEMFTLCHDADERRAFAEAIAAAARAPDDPVRVICTLRDDFLVRTEQLTALRNRIGQGLQLLTVPASDDLLRILVEPARRLGYDFEDRQLPQEMVAEVADQPGALALISFTAQQLWELRDRQFHQLTRAAYKTLGGVAGALARHADLTLDAMPPEQRALARESFRHLVTSQSTRAVLARSELRQLLGSTEAADRVIEKLVAARLLVASENEAGGETIEIVHEALLVAWPRLVEWRREDNEGARFREQLRSAAKQWDDRRRPRGLLWRGDAFAELTRWQARHSGPLTDVESAFADASQRDARRGRRIRNALVAIGVAVPVAIAIVLVVSNARITEQRAQTELANQELNLTLQRQWENQGREKVLAGEPLQALAYLDKANQLGATGTAHDFLVAQAVRATEGKLFELHHDDAVRSPKFSPDGRLIVTAGFDQQARIWDARDGKLLVALHHGGVIPRATFSPDSKTVLTASWSGTAAWWDATTGKQLATLPHAGYVWCVQFSPDGKLALTAGEDDMVALWDLATGAARFRMHGSGAGFRACSFSHDGARIAAGDTAGAARVWDARSGTLLEELRDPHAGRTGVPRDHRAHSSFMQFSPDDTRLLSASHDGNAIVWDVATGHLVHELEHTGAVTYAEFSQNGAMIVTSSEDHTAGVWDAASGARLATLAGHGAGITRATFSPDGRYIVTASQDSGAWLWDVASATVVSHWRGHQDVVFDVAFDPSGKRVVTASDDGNAIVWNVEPQERVSWLRGHTGTVVAAAFSHDGSLAATGGADGTIRLWDVASGKQVEVLSAGGPGITDVAFGPGPRELAAGADDGAVRVWRDGNAITLPGASGPGAKVAWSRDGASIVSCTDDGAIRGWDARTGALRFENRRAHDGKIVFAIALDPRGSSFVTTGADSVARLWNLDGMPRSQFRDRELLTAAFDPSGSRIVSVTSKLIARVWDARTGERIADLVGHEGQTQNAAWSERGDLIATVALDGTARLWDTRTGDNLAVIPHPKPPRAIAISPDSRRLLITGDDGTAAIHELPIEHVPPAMLERILRCRVPFEVKDDRLQPRQLPATGCDR